MQRYTFFIVWQNKWDENCTNRHNLCTHHVFCATKRTSVECLRGVFEIQKLSIRAFVSSILVAKSHISCPYLIIYGVSRSYSDTSQDFIGVYVETIRLPYEIVLGFHSDVLTVFRGVLKTRNKHIYPNVWPISARQNAQRKLFMLCSDCRKHIPLTICCAG